MTYTIVLHKQRINSVVLYQWDHSKSFHGYGVIVENEVFDILEWILINSCD